MGEYIMFS